MGKINLHMRLVLLAAVFGISATGCVDGYCRTSKTPVNNVFVFKPDGSLQCGQGKAVAVEVMAQELETVKVISSRKQNDGLLRTTVCGAPTGQINVYEVPYFQLAKALKFGFKELKK
jgi:hypothetical protein